MTTNHWVWGYASNGISFDFLLARTRYTRCTFMVALAVYIHNNSSGITLCYSRLVVDELSDPMDYFHWILIDRLLHSMCNWWTECLLLFVWSLLYLCIQLSVYDCLSHFELVFALARWVILNNIFRIDLINILMFLFVLLLRVEQIYLIRQLDNIFVMSHFEQYFHFDSINILLLLFVLLLMVEQILFIRQ